MHVSGEYRYATEAIGGRHAGPNFEQHEQRLLDHSLDHRVKIF